MYSHFESKEKLFREVVGRNVEDRLHKLQMRLSAVLVESVADCIEQMAEATVMVYVADTRKALLTNWALLETPEFAVDLHRHEAGCVSAFWEEELGKRVADARTRKEYSMRLVPCTVHACLAYALWLAALRHSAATAAPLARQFAENVARAATAPLG